LLHIKIVGLFILKKEAGKGGAGGEGGGKWVGLVGSSFLRLRTISNFTYEMDQNLGGNCHGWQFSPGRFQNIDPFH